MEERKNSFSNSFLDRHFDFLIQKKKQYFKFGFAQFDVEEMSALKGI